MNEEPRKPSESEGEPACEPRRTIPIRNWEAVLGRTRTRTRTRTRIVYEYGCRFAMYVYGAKSPVGC
jgi:hypothetical protein